MSSKARQLADLFARGIPTGGGGVEVDPSAQDGDVLKLEGGKLVPSGATAPTAGELRVNDLVTAPDSVRIGATQKITAAGSNLGVVKVSTGAFFHPVWQSFGDDKVFMVRWGDEAAVPGAGGRAQADGANPSVTVTVPSSTDASIVGVDVVGVTLQFAGEPPAGTRVEVEEEVNGVWQPVFGHTHDPSHHADDSDGSHTVRFDAPYRAYIGQQFRIDTHSPHGDVMARVSRDGDLAVTLHVRPIRHEEVAGKSQVDAVDARVTALESRPAGQAQMSDADRRAIETGVMSAQTYAANAATAEQGAQQERQLAEQAKAAAEQIETNTMNAVNALAAAGRAPGQLVMSHGFDFIATDGQTVFSGADANAHNLAYAPNSGVSVVRNGIALRATTDFTAHDGTSVTLATAAKAGDWLRITPLVLAETIRGVQGVGDVPGLQAALADKFSPSNLPGLNDVSGLQAALGDAFGRSNKPRINDVSGLSALLASKFGADNAPGVSDVTGLQAALDDKFSQSNQPSIASVTGLQAALDAKAEGADVTSFGAISNGRRVGARTWLFETSGRVQVTRAGTFKITIVGGGGGGAGGDVTTTQIKRGGGHGGGGGAVRVMAQRLEAGQYSVWVGRGGAGGAGRTATQAAQPGSDGSVSAVAIARTNFIAEFGRGATAEPLGNPGIGGASNDGSRPGGWGGYGDHWGSGAGGASGGSDAHNRVERDSAGYAQRQLGGDGFGGGGIGAAMTPLVQTKQANGGAGADAERSLSTIEWGNFGGGGGGGAPAEREGLEAGDGGAGAPGVVIFEAIGD